MIIKAHPLPVKRQAELLEIAANSQPNAENIGLVGLQASGVEFA